MSRSARQGGKKRESQGEQTLVHSSPCLLVSLSPRLASLLVAIATLGAGCSQDAAQPRKPARPRPSLTLDVLVVNEPELVEAIDRLRGEWAEQGTGELKVSGSTWTELSAADSIDADVVIFPSRYLGEMSVHGWLRPVRASVLESQRLNVDDFFPLVRTQLMNWGGKEMALPLGARWSAATSAVDSQHPGLSLLVRAAPRVVSPERLGVLFEPQSMRPLIAEPAFEEALAEVVEEQKVSRESDTADKSKLERVQQGMDKSEASAAHAPLIGYNDRLAAVTASSHNAASAFKLLEWLASPETSSQFARAGEAVMPVRHSLAASAKWYDDALTAEERAQRAQLLEAALSADQFLAVPRIPGIDEYLSKLDVAVNAAVSGGVEPKMAVETAVQQWEEITENRGRAAQQAAYLKHLGVDSP